MSAVIVKVPDIGDFKDIPVIEIFVKPGDSVAAEDSLVTLESDKATMDVPSPAAGVVRELKVKAGEAATAAPVVATPVTYFAAHHLGTQSSVMVTGSSDGPGPRRPAIAVARS